MEEINFELDQTQLASLQTPPKQKGRNEAHVIVFGNIKGGSGKSTTAMHTAIALLRLGYKIGTIDLDARQGTLSRYMTNRFNFITEYKKYIPSPTHLSIDQSTKETVKEQQAEEQEFLEMALREFGKSCDFIIVDTPGADSFLSRLAHGHADTIITPLNDSLIDLDVLARIDPKTYEIKEPSVYTEMIRRHQNVAYQMGKEPFNWIVMRNRLSHINAKNKKNMGMLLDNIAHKFGFTVAPGFGERVVFRELFLKGLTLLDIKTDPRTPMTLSQITARQEVRQLIMTLNPEKLKGQRRPLKKKEQAG